MERPNPTPNTFTDTGQSLSQALAAAAASLTEPRTTLRQLLTVLGEHGLLALCAVLSLPFLLPVSVPGVSLIFGPVVVLLAIAITRNRVPWLPDRLMRFGFPTDRLRLSLERGARFIARFDRVVRPRWLRLTGNLTLYRLHGVALTVGAALMTLPLGWVPLANTLPGLAVLLLSLGMMQRDGAFIALGYAAIAATVVYFSVLAIGVVSASRALGVL
jgi:hypothetical protein